MSDVPINPGVPSGPLPTSDEGIAERFLDKELVESRASLKRTQVVGVLLSVFVIGYMGYLTAGFRASLEPTGAAQIATGLASQRIDDMEPQFASYIREQVPQMIRKAPDEVIARLPEYRKNLEDRVVTDLQAQAQKSSTELGKNLDEFLTVHKDQVATLLKSGDDPATIAAMGDEMEGQFRTFLHEQKVGDTTLAEKLDRTLATLRLVSARTSRLEKNVGLTPSEKSARHAVGMLMHRIKRAQAAEPNAIPALDPEAVRRTTAQATEAVRSHLSESLSPTTTTGATTKT